MSVVTDDDNSTHEKAEVFYVDYGNTELMPIDRLVRQYFVSIDQIIYAIWFGFNHLFNKLFNWQINFLSS